MLCYCNSGKPFSECCEPIISNKTQAITAEQLMRSRYSAFVIADINYLMRSHHPSSRPMKERNEILKWTQSVKWIGLQIVRRKSGMSSHTEGWVEFNATYIENSQLECIHEKSYFVKEKGVWYYKSGTHN